MPWIEYALMASMVALAVVGVVITFGPVVGYCFL
jgi:Flp pilus assembly pilin Flp